MRICVVVSLLLFTLNTSYASRGFALKAIGHANGSIMASPPLPNSLGKEGTSSLTTRGTYFASSGGNEGESESFSGQVDYSGQALGTLYHSQWTNMIGFFLLGSYNQLSGNFSSTTGSGLSVKANDVESSLLQVSVGPSLRLFSGSFIPIQFFAGPSFVKVNIEQKITSNEGDDFDMIVDSSVLSYIVGIQASILLTKHIALNPYYVKTDFLSANDKCQEFESEVRTHGPLFDLSDESCQEGEDSSTSQIEFDTAFSAFGLNVIFPTIGLGVNAIAELENIPGFEGAHLSLYSISYTFSF